MVGAEGLFPKCGMHNIWCNISAMVSCLGVSPLGATECIGAYVTRHRTGPSAMFVAIFLLINNLSYRVSGALSIDTKMSPSS